MISKDTSDITVVKQDGTREPFDPDKLRESLRQAQTPDDEVEKIVAHIESELEDGQTTTEIYKHAYELLKLRKHAYAARYSLKDAVAELGPTGYPFENFVAEIFKQRGYDTQTDVYIEGKCIEHEIDVVAETDDSLILVEAKFHNGPHIKSDLKVALYIKARFNDLAANDYGEFNTKGKRVEHWLVTNTKFTEKAVEYGTCADLTIVGWGYPTESEKIDNLETLIETSALQPVTALTTLSSSNKRDLTDNDVVLCRTLRTNKHELKKIGLSDEQIEEVMSEVNDLCHA